MGVLRNGTLRLALAGVAIAAAITVGAALGQPSAPSSSPSAKTIKGTHRADHLVGTKHGDRIKGLKGADVINGKGGTDTLLGGPGADKIKARDGKLDYIDCGPGKDVAVVDRAEDGVVDCEEVRVPRSDQRGRR